MLRILNSFAQIAKDQSFSEFNHLHRAAPMAEQLTAFERQSLKLQSLVVLMMQHHVLNLGPQYENSETFNDMMDLVQAAVGETASLLSAKPKEFSDATKST